MPETSPLIRLFISSTFTDFAFEREVLQRTVFPQLRALCVAQGCRFQLIDLRWGVSEEAGNNKQTLAICLAEIARCQRLSPDLNLLILLGDRYGSCFLPESVPSHQVARLLPQLTPADQTAFTQAYREDLNALRPEYVLLPNDGSAAIRQGEDLLQHALIRAAKSAGFSEPELRPFVASAIHQEIQRGLLDADCDPAATICALRTLDVPPVEQQPQLAALKAAVVQRLGNERIWQYKAPREFTGSQAIEAAQQQHGPAPLPLTDPLLHEASAHYDDLAKIFYALLEPRIQQALVRRKAIARSNDPTTAANQQFTIERARVVVGRDAELQTIATYLSSQTPVTLIVSGAAGVGKSTLLAQAVKEASHTYPQAVIVTRFIGVTPGTSTLAALLSGLQDDIAKCYGLPNPAPGTNLDKCVTAVRQQLFSAEIPPERPLFLFIDALDQLGADTQRVDWLPYHLAPNVHVILSLLSDRLELIDLHQRIPDGHEIQLASLTRAEGQQLLRTWLAAEQRRITPGQEAAVLDGFASEPEERGRPIYLRLALEEARTWRSFEDEHTSPLPPSVPELIQAYFAWLEHPARHGYALVAHVMGSLAASRHGLAEDETLDVLSRSADVRTELHDLSPMAPPIDPQLPLPMSLWARLASHLDNYLTEREADGVRLLEFYHRQVREEVEKRYLSGDERAARHAALADYFDAQQYHLSANGLTNQTAGTIANDIWNARKLAEIAYQQAGAGSRSSLETTLTDVRFLEGKLTAEGITATLDDLALAAGNAAIMKMSAAIRMGAVVLAHEPSEVLNQIIGRIGHLSQLHHLSDPSVARLQVRSQTFTPPDLKLLRILQSNEGGLESCALSADGRLALSASRNGMLGLWDTTTGESLRTWQNSAISTHPAPTLLGIRCALSHDGRLALSTSRLALHVWDTTNGKNVCTLDGHTDQVHGCAISGDGRLVLSVSADNTLRLWNVATGQSRILPPLSGHTKWAGNCAISADGRFALAACWNATATLFGRDADHKFGIWDTGTGQIVRELEGHTYRVWGCALSADGHLALAAVDDRTLRLWDTVSGKLLRTLNNVSNTTCALSADGRLALSVSDDHTLRLWDTAKDQIINVFEGHTSWPTAFVLSADGRLVLSVSGNSMWVWDATERHDANRQKRRSLPKGRCALSADGRLALSAAGDSNKLVLWDTTSWQTQRIFEGDKLDKFSICALDADGHMALGASHAGETIQLWDATSGEVLHTKGAFQGYLLVKNDCALNADGRRALIASWGRRLRIMDTASGRTLRFLRGHKDLVLSCALSADGRLALSASEDHTLRLWDTAKGRTVQILDGLADPVHGCALSADGRLALSFCSRFRGEVKTLQVWDTMRGQVLHVLEGHSSAVTDCALSADGGWALSSSRDKTLRLWDTASGQEIARWTHEVSLDHCVLSANGHVVVASDANNGVHVFEVIGRNTSADARTARVTASWLAEREPQKPGRFRRGN